MKKTILLLTAFILVFSSCKKDDDTAGDMTDPIIGTWKFFKYLENGVEQPLDPCENEETLVFLGDGKVSGTYSEEVNGVCQVIETNEGTWTNAGNGNYTFIDADDPEPYTEKLTFQDNNSIFYYEYTDTSGTPDDTSDDIVERDLFKRQ